MKKYLEKRKVLEKKLQAHDPDVNVELFMKIKREIQDLDENFYSVEHHVKMLMGTCPAE